MLDFTKPYTIAVRAGEIPFTAIDEYVEYWHQNDTGNSLQEFLGMTKAEYVQWIKYSDEKLPRILGLQLEPPEIPTCKMCGCKLGVRIANGSIICSSSYIEDNDYCHECQVEHCLTTNCLSCTIGEYPNCRHKDLKDHYLEQERIEAEEEAKAQENNRKE